MSLTAEQQAIIEEVYEKGRELRNLSRRGANMAYMHNIINLLKQKLVELETSLKS